MKAESNIIVVCVFLRTLLMRRKNPAMCDVIGRTHRTQPIKQSGETNYCTKNKHVEQRTVLRFTSVKVKQREKSSDRTKDIHLQLYFFKHKICGPCDLNLFGIIPNVSIMVQPTLVNLVPRIDMQMYFTIDLTVKLHVYQDIHFLKM